MTEIHNSDIQKRIIEEAKLQLSVDNVPTELTEKILPVLNVNPYSRKKLILFKDLNTRNIFNNGLYVPAGKKWEILLVYMKLVTDATVADRRAGIDIYSDSAFTGIFHVVSDIVQEASETSHYNFMQGFGLPANTTLAVGTGQEFFLPLPKNLILFKGGNIWGDCANLQAGDNLTFVCLIQETDLLIDEVESKLVP